MNVLCRETLTAMAMLLYALAIAPRADAENSSFADDKLTPYRTGSITLVDARPFRHCHNTPRRVYCHTREWLPLTVPDRNRRMHQVHCPQGSNVLNVWLKCPARDCLLSST